MRLVCAVISILTFGQASPLLAQTAFDQTELAQPTEEFSARTDNRSDNYRVESPTTAQTVLPSQGDPEFVVGSIIIDGNVAVGDGEFVDLIERFTARSLTQGDLSLLADAIAQRAREKGYIFATAKIPEQGLQLGVLRIRLDEGRIDEIRINGAQDPAIRRQLAPLVSGTPITRNELERRILLADDISGVRILDTRFEMEGETGVLIVRTRRSRASASVELRNNGSEPVGPVRARIDADFNGLLSSADEIDVSIGTTPFQPGELQYASGSYRIVVDASGLELGAHISYSSTAPGAFLADRDITGRFWRGGVNASYPAVRRRDLSVWVIGEFEVTELKQKNAGELARRDRVPTVRAGIYSRGLVAGGRYRSRIAVSRGLSILSATRSGDPLASRSDASAQFTSLGGWFSWERALTDRLSIALGARGQIADNPVLATEDIGLGGTSFLRGYNFNARTGDQGIMGYGELRRSWTGSGFWLPRGQIYVFADGGVVSNLEGGFDGGSLASAGGGVRLDITRDLDLDFEVAVPLSGPRFDSESEAPQVNVRVQQSF